MAVGAAFVVTGAMQLGRRLSALPYPVPGGVLLESGAYRLVRHPMYAGAVFTAVGWALTRRGPFTLVSAFLLFLFFDRKARREEAWLVERFPAYADYRRRVRKLVPFVY
jgi:protein-S-isoprenylcysteine O-methyltransferase Ste14